MIGSLQHSQRRIEPLEGSLDCVCNILLQVVVADGVLRNLDRSLLMEDTGLKLGSDGS